MCIRDSPRTGTGTLLLLHSHEVIATIEFDRIPINKNTNRSISTSDASKLSFNVYFRNKHGDASRWRAKHLGMTYRNFDIRFTETFVTMSNTITSCNVSHLITVYLRGAISADWDLRSVEVTRRIQRAWACFERYNGHILPSECAFMSEGADAESRGNRDTSIRCVT